MTSAAATATTATTTTLPQQPTQQQPTQQQPTQQELVIPFTFYGAAGEMFTSPAPEFVLAGAAGTGKTRSCLEKLHYLLATTPRMRALMVRKTLQSLKTSAILTYEEKVQPFLDGVRFVNESRREAAHYLYPSGAKLYIGGMDKPQKVMSSEYDVIYVPEATELHEADWDALTTRLRNGRLFYQQLIGDCNPDAPTHWLKQRADSGRALLRDSRHEDNPLLYDHDAQAWTAEGVRYLAVLDNLTGVRKLRLRHNIWAAAEGMVYEDAWERGTHLLPRATYSTRPDSLWGNCGIAPEWPRYLGIDWGYRNPAVVKWYVMLPDGELVVYRELYTTMQLVEDLAREALALMGWKLNEQGALVPTREDADPLPREIIADHDAEDRATFERHFGLAVYPANKGANSVNIGIQAVTKRLQDKRLLYLEGSLVRRDGLLAEAKKPCCSADEFESYVWDTRAGRPPKEQPIDANNHGMDVDRYVVLYFDHQEPTGGTIEFHAVGY